MSGFIDWQGWNFVGAAAGVFSLAAILFALNDWLTERRSGHTRYVDFDAYATGAVGAPPRNVEFFEVSPSGSEDIHIRAVILVGAKAIPTSEMRPQWSVRSGECFSLPIESAAMEQAWVLVHWTTSDARWWWTSWSALIAGPMQDEWERQREVEMSEAWWRRWLSHRRVMPIGPGEGGGTCQRMALSRAAGAKYEADVKMMMSLVPHDNFTMQPGVHNPSYKASP